MHHTVFVLQLQGGHTLEKTHRVSTGQRVQSKIAHVFALEEIHTYPRAQVERLARFRWVFNAECARACSERPKFEGWELKFWPPRVREDSRRDSMLSETLSLSFQRTQQNFLWNKTELQPIVPPNFAIFANAWKHAPHFVCTRHHKRLCNSPKRATWMWVPVRLCGSHRLVQTACVLVEESNSSGALHGSAS